MPRKRNVETEAKIAASATALFCTEGYVDTTMAAIAKGAGVSVQTLYLRHGSKAAILSSALDVAIAGDAEDLSLLDRDLFLRAREEGDGATALATFAAGVRGVCDRTHRLYEVIRSGSAGPEVAQVLEKNRNERAAGLLVFARRLVTLEAARPEVSAERAADVLYALGTEDSYLRLVVDRGWRAEEWEHWLADILAAQLLR